MKKRWIVVATALSLFIYGCAGNDDNRMAKPVMPDPKPTVLEPATGLAVGTGPSVQATDTLEALLSDPNLFTPLTSTVGQGEEAHIDGDLHVKSFTGNDAGGYDIVYVYKGEETGVRLTADDYRSDDFAFAVGDLYFWPVRNPGIYSAPFGLSASVSAPDGDEWQFSYWYVGARPESMPVGTATYVGTMDARAHLIEDPFSRSSKDYRGTVLLSADLDGGTIEGEVGVILRRDRDADGNRLDWVRVPDTSFSIDGGWIIDGRFTATITGRDSREDPALSDTLAGYKGGVLGEFYGPKGEEIGAVFNATSEAHGRVMNGVIGGSKF